MSESTRLDAYRLDESREPDGAVLLRIARTGSIVDDPDKRLPEGMEEEVFQRLGIESGMTRNAIISILNRWLQSDEERRTMLPVAAALATSLRNALRRGNVTPLFS